MLVGIGGMVIEVGVLSLVTNFGCARFFGTGRWFRRLRGLPVLLGYVSLVGVLLLLVELLNFVFQSQRSSLLSPDLLMKTKRLNI